jgi:hypothetical protein
VIKTKEHALKPALQNESRRYETILAEKKQLATLELREQEKTANANPRQRIAHLEHDVKRSRATDKSGEVRALQREVQHRRKLDARNEDPKWRLDAHSRQRNSKSTIARIEEELASAALNHEFVERENRRLASL